MTSLLKRGGGSCCYSQPGPAPDQRCPLCGGGKISVFCAARRAPLDRILLCDGCDFVFSELRRADEGPRPPHLDVDRTAYEQDGENRRKTAQRRLRIVESYAAKGKLLDVGCASGAFQNAASNASWQVTGVAPAPEMCAEAGQLLERRGEVVCATLQQAALPKESFDALTLWNVLEHVTDPVTFLRECAALLKPGGHLFVNVPDVRGWPARILGERWPPFLAGHLNYFDRATLKRCAAQAGLEWVAYGRLPKLFSLEYILCRAAQHGIAGSGWAYGLVRKSFLRRASVPVPLGETWGVWRQL